MQCCLREWVHVLSMYILREFTALRQTHGWWGGVAPFQQNPTHITYCDIRRQGLKKCGMQVVLPLPSILFPSVTPLSLIHI